MALIFNLAMESINNCYSVFLFYMDKFTTVFLIQEICVLYLTVSMHFNMVMQRPQQKSL